MQFEEKNCQACGFRHTCEEAYRRLGHNRTGPVTLKVVLAFLLPAIAFIISIAFFEKIFSRLLNTEWLTMVLSLLTAVSITLVLILIIKKICNKFNKTP